MKKDKSEKKLIEELEQSDWFLERLENIQKRILEYPPIYKYKLLTSGHTVRIYSYQESSEGECETCQVLVLNEDNPQGLVMERRVFGIKFSDLEKI